MCDENLDSFVDWNLVGDVDVSGKVGVDKAKLYRLKKWQSNVASAKGDRNLEFAFGLVERYCVALGVPKCVRVESVDVYKSCVDKGLLKGRSVEVLVGCCIYIGCRLCRVAFSVDEVCDCVGVGKKEVSKLFRVVRKELVLDLPRVQLKDYVVRYGKVLVLDGDVYDRVDEILELASVNGLNNGRNPLGLVGGAIYLACVECGDRRSQRDIGDVLGVSEVTIRKRCGELEELI